VIPADRSDAPASVGTWTVLEFESAEPVAVVRDRIRAALKWNDERRRTLLIT